MKGTTILLLLGVAAGGAYLYRRGRQAHQTIGQTGDPVATVRAGAASVWADLRASRPSSSDATPADHTPATAGTSSGIRNTVPSHTMRANELTQPRTVTTISDLLAQGIAL